MCWPHTWTVGRAVTSSAGRVQEGGQLIHKHAPAPGPEHSPTPKGAHAPCTHLQGPPQSQKEEEVTLRPNHVSFLEVGSKGSRAAVWLPLQQVPDPPPRPSGLYLVPQGRGPDGLAPGWICSWVDLLLEPYPSRATATCSQSFWGPGWGTALIWVTEPMLPSPLHGKQ